MMSKRARTGLALAAISVAGACGGSKDSRFGDTAPDGGGVQSPDASSGGPGYDAGISFGSGDDSGSSCALHCSADLHDVLDCNNTVVTQCPPDQGCGGAGCVAACDAATANKSTIGCDYYSVDPGTDGEANGSCFAAYIANTWTTPVTLTVEYNGQTLDVSGMARIPSGQGSSLTYAPLPNGQLPPGQLAILFLADDPNLSPPLPTRCPAGVTAGYSATEASSEYTGILNAFHITSSAPVVAYDIFPYGGSLSYISSATLLIPTSAWDTNYIAVDSFAQSTIAGATAEPFIEITAAQNNTHVTISPTADIVGGTGVAATATGKPATYTLNAGQVLQFKQPAELNGSPIQSDKPVGVWGGNSCMNIDVGDAACDSGHQELFPVKALGNEYVAARYRDRQSGNVEQPPWRIVGAVDNTTLTYEPKAPAGAPTTLSSGQLVMFYDPGPFVVRSQDASHPFYMSAHMGGQNFGGGDYGTGDPEDVNVVAPAEYLSSYVFMTDPTMANTNLALVRKQAPDGTFKDVTLDCAGTVTGWKDVGKSGYQVTDVDLVVGGTGSGSCNNGRHEADSQAPFGLTVWGWDVYVSYAYPSGMSVQPINTVVVPPVPK
jgi:IgGFc binding protein